MKRNCELFYKAKTTLFYSAAQIVGPQKVADALRKMLSLMKEVIEIHIQQEAQDILCRKEEKFKATTLW